MRGTPVFRAPPISPGKHPLSAHLVSHPGKTPTFRAPQSRPKSTPTSTTGFGSLPTNRPGLRKLPTRQSMSSMWSPYHFILCTQLGRVSPSGTRFHLHTPDANKCGMRLTNHFISTIGRIHSHPCIRPTSILSEWHYIDLIWSLFMKIYGFPGIRRTIHITSLYHKTTTHLLPLRRPERLTTFPCHLKSRQYF